MTTTTTTHPLLITLYEVSEAFRDLFGKMPVA